MQRNVKKTCYNLSIVSCLTPAIIYSQIKNEASAVPVIWRDPGDLTARDLRFGSGGPHLLPTGVIFPRKDMLKRCASESTN